MKNNNRCSRFQLSALAVVVPNYLSLQYVSTDDDGNGINGVPMVDGPFIGISANFNLGATDSCLVSNTVSDPFTFMHAFRKEIKGPTAFGPGGTPVVGTNASIVMSETSLSIAYGIKF